MDSKPDVAKEKKPVSKTKSFNHETKNMKIKKEIKKKTFEADDIPTKTESNSAIRLKKSKVMPEASCRSLGMAHFRQHNETACRGFGNVSQMSLNFSQYDLQRHLSRLNCDSEDAMSDATGNLSNRVPCHDYDLKDDRIERYFRSAEMWSNDGIPKSIQE